MLELVYGHGEGAGRATVSVWRSVRVIAQRGHTLHEAVLGEGCVARLGGG